MNLAAQLRRCLLLPVSAILLSCMLAPCVDNVSAQGSQLQAHHWQHRLFYVPYKVSRPERMLDPVQKVQLLTSPNGVSNWQVLQEAEPNVQGFSYHAPADGEYWFALRHIDRRGQPWPSATIQPQMRVIVDSVKPQLSLDTALDANGDIVVRYEASDANLRNDSLHIEVRPTGGSWQSLKLDAHDVAHRDRLLGRAHGQIAGDAATIEVRAHISDQAGNKGEATENLETAGPAFNLPDQSDIAGATRDPFQSASTSPRAVSPSVSWPTLNEAKRDRETVDIGSAPDTFAGPPPILNPYVSTPDQQSAGYAAKTPARLVGDQVSRDAEDFSGFKETEPALDSDFNAYQPATENDNDWQPAQAADVTNVRTVNSQTFDVDYDLSAVGPWGVSRVELWGTFDEGANWQRFGTDLDNRSPMRVNVPESGSYGFKIVVHAAGGAETPPPRSGDTPELVVDVDLDAPTAEIVSVQSTDGELTGHLQIRWTATDTNLDRSPVSLFYASNPNGPWSPIAAGLPNFGSYTWQMERHVPSRFFVKLEVRDTAGNVAEAQTDTPFVIARPQPTGKLRGVRPVKDSGLYETANNGAR